MFKVSWKLFLKPQNYHYPHFLNQGVMIDDSQRTFDEWTTLYENAQVFKCKSK